MQKQKENIFSEKFKLLHSQENGENINWSASESSDYENVNNIERCYKISNRICSRKRKRKKKVNTNLSNLDIIVDLPKDNKNAPSKHKSAEGSEKTNVRSRETSPVFIPTSMYFPPYKSTKFAPNSPILTSKCNELHIKSDKPIKSPILVLKHMSPKSSAKIKKNLFNTKMVNEISPGEYVRITDDSVIKSSKDDVDNSGIVKAKRQSGIIYEYDNTSISKCDKILKREETDEKIKSEMVSLSIDTELDENSQINDNRNDSFENKTNIAKKIKCYFDSNFSSENSQQTISDILTPKQSSKTSDEIDITSSVTQVNSYKINTQIGEQLNKTISPISSQSAEIHETSKKIRYKKNGLAHRLNILIKKQNANISLWQHERYLAENSNFVIPKGENVIFRIQKVSFKYGCYSLEAVNADEDAFVIIINNSYISNVNISTDVVLKLYEPYKIVDINKEYKIIINVCKFECLPFEK